MTTDRILQLLRRLLTEVDAAVADSQDDELLEALRDARERLELRKVAGMSSLAVEPDQTVAGYGITPEPTTEQGHMLAMLAAADLLDQSYRGRLYRGELGTAWTSGLESESSISAERAYRAAISGLRADLAELILIKRAPSMPSRPT